MANFKTPHFGVAIGIGIVSKKNDSDTDSDRDPDKTSHITCGRSYVFTWSRLIEKQGADMDEKFVYVTTSDLEEAKKIGRRLLENRLAACVNIIKSVESMFWWEGRVQEATETVLIAKSTRQRLPELIASVKKDHSYECPCIVALDIEAGNPDFLKWIADETTRS